jgi:hypothetical protein
MSPSYVVVIAVVNDAKCNYYIPEEGNENQIDCREWSII